MLTLAMFLMASMFALQANTTVVLGHVPYRTLLQPAVMLLISGG